MKDVSELQIDYNCQINLSENSVLANFNADSNSEINIYIDNVPYEDVVSDVINNEIYLFKEDIVLTGKENVTVIYYQVWVMYK